MFQTFDSHPLALKNFEGPLELLLYLIQKGEIDIYDVRLKEITEQILSVIESSLQESPVDAGAEYLSITATLVLLKSRMLLPKEEQLNDEEGLDPRFEIIQQLLDYCRFKQAAQNLTQREKEQQTFFVRGIPEAPVKRKEEPSFGLHHLTLSDLAGLLEQLLQRAASRQPHIIREEIWRVSDKMNFIRQLVGSPERTLFSALFPLEKTREELIVTFLAVLELMKLGELAVVEELATGQIFVTSKNGQEEYA